MKRNLLGHPSQFLSRVTNHILGKTPNYYYKITMLSPFLDVLMLTVGILSHSHYCYFVWETEKISVLLSVITCHYAKGKLDFSHIPRDWIHDWRWYVLIHCMKTLSSPDSALLVCLKCVGTRVIIYREFNHTSSFITEFMRVVHIPK